MSLDPLDTPITLYARTIREKVITGLDLLNFTSVPMLREKRDLSQMPVVFIPEV